MSVRKRLENELKKIGFKRTAKKEYWVVEFSKAVNSDMEFMVLIIKGKGSAVSIDCGPRVNSVEQCLELYEKEQMLKVGFLFSETIRRPTFYNKVFDGPINGFNVDDFLSQYRVYLEGDIFTDEKVASYLDCLRNYQCPPDFDLGSSTYLAKRLLIFLFIKNEYQEYVFEEIINRIDGVKVYLDDMLRLKQWLLSRPNTD